MILDDLPGLCRAFFCLNLNLNLQTQTQTQTQAQAQTQTQTQTQAQAQAQAQPWRARAPRRPRRAPRRTMTVAASTTADVVKRAGPRDRPKTAPLQMV